MLSSEGKSSSAIYSCKHLKLPHLFVTSPFVSKTNISRRGTILALLARHRDRGCTLWVIETESQDWHKCQLSVRFPNFYHLGTEQTFSLQTARSGWMDNGMTFNSLTRSRARIPAMVSLIWFIPALLHSQVLVDNQSPTAFIPALTMHKQVQEVSLLLTVTDRQGHLVHNLTSSDFTIHDNGELPKRITYFERQADLPLRVAILIDTSGSVTDSFTFEQKAAAIFLSNILRPKSDLALIIGFNNTPLLVQPATNNTGLLSLMIHSLQIRGETAVFDAVSMASQELGKINDASPARRVIVLITDGEDNSSHLNLQQAIEIAQRNDCFVYVLQVRTFITSESEAADHAMGELSKATGGQVMSADNGKKLVRAFSTIEKDLRSQYAIGYTPANLTPNGSFHRLIVVGPRKLRVYHREGYFAR